MQPVNFLIETDTNFSQRLVFYIDRCMTSVIDLTGYSFLAQIRATAESSTVIATFDIAVEASSGAVTLSLDDTDTIDLTAGTYVWDLRITDDEGTVLNQRPGGEVTVTQTVSRA